MTKKKRTSSRPPRRAGLGSLREIKDSAGLPRASLDHARRLFIEAVSVVEPRVLSELAEQALPIYRKICSVSSREFDPIADSDTAEPEDNPKYSNLRIDLETIATTSDSGRKLRGVLIEWSEGWHLNSNDNIRYPNWIHEIAERILRAWKENDPGPPHLPESFWDLVTDLPIPKLNATLGAWEPHLTGETWQHFERKAKGSGVPDADLITYKEAVELLLTRPPRMNRENPVAAGETESVPRHLHWLALYQVGEVSQRAIARQIRSSTSIESPRHSVIQYAIRSAAAIIGLSLRPVSPPGRPSGSSNRRNPSQQ